MISCSQLTLLNRSTLALAASQIVLPPLPPSNPLLESPPESTINASPLDNITKKGKTTGTKSGTKSKMRPSATKNGRNLCALRWLKQTKSNGTTEEFNAYYSSLTSTQRTEYDKDAANLAATDTWSKTVCDGKIH
ncbi:hypothetical protein DEU56DRAFT_816807 [Suillus clintonianus]|uniref:uncharacterized protein n=1 Tax=Suillus clintonianus TaxID=1904413 RepID=UPI001B86A334|nr:uncharacterized protein DEU56DRAFT_816807 [Suillus clintonianus]KAG2129579.1 hypothetical protein DEU56DRAFT_816807 [Suillus clintonianus]